jgi:DNA-directed RNA polymerase subunit RPC12/RpoP
MFTVIPAAVPLRRTALLAPAPDTKTPPSAAAAAVGARMSQGYRCAQCGKVHQLNMRDTVRCVTCGYRIMYKLRNNALKNCYVAR